MGPGGVLYAGNTGGAEYALNPNGRLRWLHPTGNSVWSNAAIGTDGSVYFGSLDLNIYALDSRGRLRWKRGTLGFVTSSPAIGPKGTVYIGSFDGAAARARPRTGEDRWSYMTDDHVYASPALGEGSVYVASADGSVYAFDLRGDPALALRHRRHRALVAGARPGAQRRRPHPLRGLRQRPAVRARRPHRPPALVLRHHAARPGARGPQRPQLVARARPARRLHRRRARAHRVRALRLVPAPRRTPRCNRSPGEAFGGNLTRMAYVTPGGSTRLTGPAGPAARGHRDHHAPARAPARRDRGRRPHRADERHRRPALRVHRPALRRRPLPAHHPHRLPPARAHVHPARRGRLERRRALRHRDDTIRFRTARVRRRGPPLRRGDAFRLSRLAVPLPPILPSLNQIGFDSYEMAVGALDVVANGNAAALGGQHQAGHVDRRPPRRVRLPAAGPLPRRLAAALPARPQPDVLVRRRPAAPLRPAHAARRRPARARREPDRRGVLPRGAGLRRRRWWRSASATATRSCPRAARSSPAPTAARPTAGRRACGSQRLQLRRPTATQPGLALARLGGAPLAADRHAAAILLDRRRRPARSSRLITARRFP